jgi:hypothetical protein
MSRSNYDSFFKEVPAGFVFRPPSQWLFGSVQNYIVNPEQKAEILDVGRTRHPVLRTAIFILALIGCPAGSILMAYGLSDRVDFGWADAVITTVLILGSYYALCVIAIRSQLRRLRPVLARLIPTDKELTVQEVQALQAKGMSSKASIILGLVNAGLVIAQAVLIALGALNIHSILLLLMFMQAAFAWKYLSQAISKMRASSGAS